jgi:hypothetical protein
MLVVTLHPNRLYRSENRDQLVHEDSLILSDIFKYVGLSPDSSQAIIGTKIEGVHIVNVPKNKKEHLIKKFVNIKYSSIMEIIWFNKHLFLAKRKKEDDYFTMFRSKNGNMVCKIPSKYKFVRSHTCKYTYKGFVTGIIDSLTNDFYSPTLASLIQLGAYDVTILNDDRQLLLDE